MSDENYLNARLLSALGSGRPERDVKKLLSDFEDSLLGCDFMPDAQFNFVVFFLRADDALRLEAAVYLFLALQVEFYLLSSAQVERLIDSLRSVHFISAGSEAVAIACADMIARSLDPGRAALIFKEAEEVEAYAFARFGVEVLRMRSLRYI
ncbi:hypothetical protein [Lysobacter sp. ESA13C]|uniref:hypothetical protein n=1 Tax=Lysobacter sp. ESA13C TaxID=2862676 RepID=UPI001CBBEAC3|nr:hypothetical protein [Lysobacter sp. ESA13C]